MNPGLVQPQGPCSLYYSVCTTHSLHQSPPPGSSSQAGQASRATDPPLPPVPCTKTERQTNQMSGNEQKWKRSSPALTGSPAQGSSPIHHLPPQQVPLGLSLQALQPSLPMNAARACPLLGPESLRNNPVWGEVLQSWLPGSSRQVPSPPRDSSALLRNRDNDSQHPQIPAVIC